MRLVQKQRQRRVYRHQDEPDPWPAPVAVRCEGTEELLDEIDQQLDSSQADGLALPQAS